MISSQCLEAELLKHLNHPGIPTIYDIEEDENYVYIVEEYIQGESLDTFVTHQSYISQELILNFGIQLCDIFIYLHEMTPYPIIYQDLKPAHIILCGSQLNLIDFGIAAFFTGSDKHFQFYGTKEYSAPEVLSGEEATPQSDLYSLGKVLLFLIESGSTVCSNELKNILQKAAAKKAEERYETVTCFKSALMQVQNTACINSSHLLSKIVVFGSKQGVGTTHIAVSLVNTLNQNGYQSIYIERNKTDSMRALIRTNPSVSEKDGIYHYKFFQGIPNYGLGIVLSPPQNTITVEDFGIYKDKMTEFDSNTLFLFVMGNDEWDIEHALLTGLQLKHLEHLVFICNYGNHKAARRYARLLRCNVYCFPIDTDSFTNTAEKETFFFNILSMKRRRHKWLSFVQKLWRKILS